MMRDDLTYPTFCEFKFKARAGEQSKSITIKRSKLDFAIRCIQVNGLDLDGTVLFDFGGERFSDTPITLQLFARSTEFPFPIMPEWICKTGTKMTITINQPTAKAGIIRLNGVRQPPIVKEQKGKAQTT